jgi:hypothetical protein
MNSFDDWKQVVRRNKLVGMWAAEKLGKTGQDAEAYSNALAVGTLDPERSDVLSKIRKDFAAAGVAQSDEQIIQVMDDFMLQGRELDADRRRWPRWRCLGADARAPTQARMRPSDANGDARRP